MIRHFTTVGLFTLLSRLLGFFRDRLMASVLGADIVADAFLIAFRLPNLFRRIFAEGAFNTAFVPLYTRKLSTEGHQVAASFAGQILTLLLLALLTLTALVEITLPWTIYILAPGFESVPGKQELAEWLSYITFPYLIFISLTAMFSGLLNAHRHFAMAAFAPVILNLMMNGSLLLATVYSLTQKETAFLLATTITFAGLLQAALVIAAARGLGIAIRLRKPAMTADIRKFFALALPALLAGGIVQINIMVGSIIASTSEGAVSYLYYADRIYQLPLGIVGAAVGVVLLPTLTRALYDETPERVLHLQNRSFDFAMLITLPSAVGIATLSQPIISVIYENGVFSEADAKATGAALLAFSFGLPAFVLIKVFQPAYFARENVKTPTLISAFNALTNIALSLALMPYLGHVGIAIATSVAAWTHVVFLAQGLIRDRAFRPDRPLFRRILASAFSSLLMGLGCFYMAHEMAEWLKPDAGNLSRFSSLALIILIAMVIYTVVGLISGATSREDLRRLLRRRAKISN